MKTRQLISEIPQSRTLSRVAIYSGIVSLYALLAVLVETGTRYSGFSNLPADVHAALTLILGWLLVFRTNTSYARWWEARTLWGSLINASRQLAVKIVDFVPAADHDLLLSRNLICGFAVALKDHLRSGAILTSLDGFRDSDADPEHVPSWLISTLYRRLGAWKAAGLIDGDELRILDDEARRFLDICGGCERIRNTRLARSYRLFARQCVFLYLLTLPWGIVQNFVWWTIPLTAMLSYFMLGLETVAEHVEEPFGLDDDDLDLDGLCGVIRRSVDEIFDRRPRLDHPESGRDAGASAVT